MSMVHCGMKLTWTAPKYSGGGETVPMPLDPLPTPKRLTIVGSNVGVRIHTTEKHLLSQLIIIRNRKAIPGQTWTGPDRPGQALGVPGSSGSKVSGPLANEDGKVVSPTHRAPLPPRNIPGTYFC
jgi:hypothetical protein